MTEYDLKELQDKISTLARDLDALRDQLKAQKQHPYATECLIIGLLTHLRTDRNDPDNTEIDQILSECASRIGRFARNEAELNYEVVNAIECIRNGAALAFEHKLDEFGTGNLQ